MRRSRLIVASFVCVLSITPVAGATKPVAPADSWLAYGHDAQLTNFVPSRLLTPRTAPYLADKWTTQLDGAVVASPLYASGVSVDGRERDVLLFETEAGSIYALDPLDGTIIWRDSFGVITTPDGACGSYGFSSTPAIDEQRGVVYAISADGYIRGNPAVLLELALGGRDAADRGRAPPRVKVGRAPACQGVRLSHGCAVGFLH